MKNTATANISEVTPQWRQVSGAASDCSLAETLFKIAQNKIKPSGGGHRWA